MSWCPWKYSLYFPIKYFCLFQAHGAGSPMLENPIELLKQKEEMQTMVNRITGTYPPFVSCIFHLEGFGPFFFIFWVPLLCYIEYSISFLLGPEGFSLEVVCPNVSFIMSIDQQITLKIENT